MFEEILSNSSEVKNNNIETSAADAVNNSGLSGQKVLEIVYALINADEKIRNRLKIRPGKKSKYVIYDDKFALGFDGILGKMGEHVDLNLPVKQIIEQLPPDCKKDITLTLAKAFNLLLDFDKNSFTEADKTYFISEFKNYHSKLRSLMEEYAKNNIDLHDLETFYAKFDVPKEINSAIDYFWDLAKKHPCSKEMVNVKTTAKKKYFVVFCSTCKLEVKFNIPFKEDVIYEYDLKKFDKYMITILSAYEMYNKYKTGVENLKVAVEVAYERTKKMYNQLKKDCRQYGVPLLDVRNVRYQIRDNSIVFHNIDLPKEILEDKEKLTEIICNYVIESLQESESMVREAIDEEREREQKLVNELRSNQDLAVLLKAVNRKEGYGRTTYADMLMGIKSSKIEGYKMDKEPFFGKLNHRTKKSIVDDIDYLEDKGILRTQEYYGGWGIHYPVVKVTEMGKKILGLLNNAPMEEKEKTLQEKMSSLNRYSTMLKKEILNSIRPEEFAENFEYMFNFLLTEREKYRDVLDDFLSLFKYTPSKYIPFIQMNYNLETGVIKQSLKEILKILEG